jgi:hypothetical protein
MLAKVIRIPKGIDRVSGRLGGLHRSRDISIGHDPTD